MVLGGGLFVVDVTAVSPDPVDFEETIHLGMAETDVRIAEDAGYEVPRVEVFYAQYRYVVGYYGVESFVDAVTTEGHERRFGPPRIVYVTGFDGLDPAVTADGFVATTGGDPAWIDGEAAWYVLVERDDERLVVPFAREANARAFADESDSDVLAWNALLGKDFDGGEDDRPDWEEIRNENADQTVREARTLLDRPVSVVVGEDAPTIQAAVDTAPPNTTVWIPAGTYEENVVVEKPITLAGSGNATHVRGDGSKAVIDAPVPGVAVSSVRITGVGNATGNVSEVHDAEGEWDYGIELAYGRGDAGIAFVNASGSLASNVTIETPANGVLVRDSAGVVVENATIYGHEEVWEGYMGVMTMRSSAVVQNSTFFDGRDAVYSHRSNGLVVRDSEMNPGRYGVHMMFTSETLIENNVIRDSKTGIMEMTRPTGNAYVGNDIRASDVGLVASGGEVLVADNVLVGNTQGLVIGSHSSNYEGNVVADNQIGVRANSIVASNRVVGNDFVANGDDANSWYGALRIWSADGRGNYWGETVAAERVGDTVAGGYRPTDPVDSNLDRPGAATLSRSPAVVGLRTLEGTVPGMRTTGIVDEHPLAEPANPELLARAGIEDLRRT